MDAVGDLVCPVDYRYGRPAARAIFARSRRLARCLSVEAALAETQAEMGLVPVPAAKAIREAADSGRVSVERVDELDRELRHDVMAITRALAEQAGVGSPWVHYGATSYDIVDTALALELKDSIALLGEDLARLESVLVALADRHKATPETGRTHGQHAVPLTFGYKMAVGAAEVARHRDRLAQCERRVVVGKVSGSVGSGAGFGARAADVEDGVMKRLGLVADEAPTQIVGRDRLAEFLQLLALMATSADRLATEVRNLQRTEIAEVQEPFDEAKQVGSSTMAQKRNPVASENVSSLARLVRAFTTPALENMVQWHERDLANSANERVIVPHAVILTDELLARLAAVFEGLTVRTEAMARNLAATDGAPMTEALILALTQRGMARSDAHELLRTVTRTSAPGPARSLAERVRAEPRITALLPPESIDGLLDPALYLAAAQAKTETVLRRLKRERPA